MMAKCAVGGLFTKLSEGQRSKASIDIRRTGACAFSHTKAVEAVSKLSRRSSSPQVQYSH